MPRRLRTHLSLLTLLSICSPQSPYTADLGRFGADSRGELLSNSLRASTVRMRSVRLGLLWVRDGEEEEDGAPLN